MPLRQIGKPIINPLPQDRDKNKPENINEQVEAQASAAGSSSIVAPPTTPQVANLNLAERLRLWQ